MLKTKKLIKKFKLNTHYIPEGVDLETQEIAGTGTTNGLYENLNVRHGERIIVLGLNDQKLLINQGEEWTREYFKNNKESQIIIVSNEFDVSLFDKYYEEFGFTVFTSNFEKYELLSMINNYISHKKAKKHRVHGSLVNIFGEGVLIVGKSGIGKSELVIDLINAKHSFVADDAVDVMLVNDRIVGQSAPETKDFIELRGVGIINARKTFGIRQILKRSDINLVVELVELDDVRDSIDRLGNKFAKYTKVDGVELPKMQIPVSSGRTLLSIVESAVTVYKHQKYEKYLAYEDLSDQLKNQ